MMVERAVAVVGAPQWEKVYNYLPATPIALEAVQSTLTAAIVDDNGTVLVVAMEEIVRSAVSRAEQQAWYDAVAALRAATTESDSRAALEAATDAAVALAVRRAAGRVVVPVWVSVLPFVRWLTDNITAVTGQAP